MEFPSILMKINTPAALHRLGRMHYERGDLDRAEELFRISACKEAWADLGALMAKKGNLVEAEMYFRKGKDASYNLGVLYWQKFQVQRV